MEKPFSEQLVSQVLSGIEIHDISRATIRQVVRASEEIERQTGEKFVHFEMGSPGLPPEQAGVEAQIKALRSGVASGYPNISGIAPLKENASKFIRAFLDIDISPSSCVPTVGSMMGTFASFMLCCAVDEKKDTLLFINPGFPVQPLQVKILRYRQRDFDIYEYRGMALKEKLEEILREGDIAAIIYSNPNNPSWACLTEEELGYIGALATEYDAVVIEDLAYLCMDFRKSLGRPFEPPYQATVARYTDNYMLMLSASKIFSYAGERVAVVGISDKLFSRKYPALQHKFGMAEFGNVFIYVFLYALSSGISHSAQYALAAMYEAACSGTLDFVDHTSEYARRAAAIKKIFLKNGFHIVYDKDMDEDVSDGFFFTIGRKGFTGDALVRELFNYGVSAISLATTGSRQEGIRICTAMVSDSQFPLLDQRLAAFDKANF